MTTTKPREFFLFEPCDSDLQETGPYLWTVFENLNNYGKEKCLKKGAIQAIEYSAYQALERKLEIAKAALEKLTIKMNPTTATWRHQQRVFSDDMDTLCNAQIDAERALKEIEG